MRTTLLEYFIGFCVIGVVVAGLVLLFEHISVDRGNCLKPNHTWIMMPVYSSTCTGTGSNMRCQTTVISFIPTRAETCDEWEYPDGRPSAENR